MYLRNNNDLLPLLSRAALCRGDGEIIDEDNLDKQENTIKQDSETAIYRKRNLLKNFALLEFYVIVLKMY